jgi:hypothetical protein
LTNTTERATNGGPSSWQSGAHEIGGDTGSRSPSQSRRRLVLPSARSRAVVGRARCSFRRKRRCPSKLSSSFPAPVPAARRRGS